jgi:anti-sigma B factor antagonist
MRRSPHPEHQPGASDSQNRERRNAMMKDTNVTLQVRKAGSSACILDIQGEINNAAEPALMNAYNQACAHGAGSILMNFSGLEYMNSSGIGLLVTLLIRVRRQNQRLLAFGLNDHYRQIFELTRLNEAIAIFDSEEEALRAA